MCEQPLGHGANAPVKEMMFWCRGWEGVCRCCWGQVLAVNFPFSLGTDFSGLMESHVLIAGNSKPVSCGGHMTRRCLSHWCSADCDPRGRWEPCPPLLPSPAASADSPALSEPLTLPSMSPWPFSLGTACFPGPLLPVENCFSFFKSQHGVTSSHEEGSSLLPLCGKSAPFMPCESTCSVVPEYGTCHLCQCSPDGYCVVLVLKMRKVEDAAGS